MRCRTEEMRSTVLQTSLGGGAFDAPMLMAFFLLLGSRGVLPGREIGHDRINQTRQVFGFPACTEAAITQADPIKVKLIAFSAQLM